MEAENGGGLPKIALVGHGRADAVAGERFVEGGVPEKPGGD